MLFGNGDGTFFDLVERYGTGTAPRDVALAVGVRRPRWRAVAGVGGDGDVGPAIAVEIAAGEAADAVLPPTLQ